MSFREANKFKVTLVDGKYFFLEINSDAEFEIEDLELLVMFQKELGGGKQYPVLILPSPTATTNSDLLKHMAQKDSLPYTKADAFVLTSIAQKILANFYLKIYPPGRPTLFFTRKEEALKWLEKFME